MVKKKNYLFEISWEVCKKDGGIYTVIYSKLDQAISNFENYYLVGPYFENSKDEFEEKETPKKFLSQTKELEKIGIKIHFGNQRDKEEVKVILVEYLNYSNNINKIKEDLWNRYKIDSLNSNWYDFDEAILWSWSCGVAIEKLTSKIKSQIYLHAHEWMSGGAIFYVDSLNQEKIKTVFTTHATMLGRSISGNSGNLYETLENINPEEKAYEIGINTKHQCEKALANCANCFTTVSQITNKEAIKFYGKEADQILYNGFSNRGIENLEILNPKFLKSRVKIEEFINSYFNNFYDVDLEKAHIFYTSGRNEFKNKGIDVYIRSLSMLNEKLKSENFEKNIINFFLVMVGDFNLSSEFESSKNNFKNNIKREFNQAFAPLSTHDLPFENEIVKCLVENNLTNKIEDKVKNIIIPVKLDKKDKILNRNYYDIILGFDLGVFPSMYEPWGYTPLESISYAVPTITTDTSGFGQSIDESCGESCPSVKVLKRLNKNNEEVSKQLFQFLNNFSKQNKKQIVFQREISKWLSLKYDWKESYKNYLKAYEKASK